MSRAPASWQLAAGPPRVRLKRSDPDCRACSKVLSLKSSRAERRMARFPPERASAPRAADGSDGKTIMGIGRGHARHRPEKTTDPTVTDHMVERRRRPGSQSRPLVRPTLQAVRRERCGLMAHRRSKQGRTNTFGYRRMRSVPPRRGVGSLAVMRARLILWRGRSSALRASNAGFRRPEDKWRRGMTGPIATAKTATRAAGILPGPLAFTTRA